MGLVLFFGGKASHRVSNFALCVAGKRKRCRRISWRMRRYNLARWLFLPDLIRGIRAAAMAFLSHRILLLFTVVRKFLKLSFIRIFVSMLMSSGANMVSSIKFCKKKIYMASTWLFILWNMLNITPDLGCYHSNVYIQLTITYLIYINYFIKHFIVKCGAKSYFNFRYNYLFNLNHEKY